MKLERAAFLVLCIFATGSLYGTDRIVGGGGNYATIQAAVDAANSGDVIKINSGVYDETVTISKQNLTLEAYDANNPPVLNGGRTISSAWTDMGNNIYRADFTWSRTQPTDAEFTIFGGGKDGKSALQVYQDGVLLRGYRNRHDSRYWDDNPPTPSAAYIDSGYSGGYREDSDLIPANDLLGLYPPLYMKQEIRVEGRFRYDKDNGKLYVRTPGLDSPDNHTYTIPEKFNLVIVTSTGDNVKLSNLILKYSSGFAVLVDGATGFTVENCYFINNHYAVYLKGQCNDAVIRNNFMQEKGLWERYWYDDAKSTLLWGNTIDLEDFYSTGIEIYNNVLYGSYSAILAYGTGTKIHDNIFSHSLSALINASEYRPNAGTAYNLQVYRNIMHHNDECGAIGLSFFQTGPLYFYRNIIYRCHTLNKAGSDALHPNDNGDKYIYNNTIVMTSGVVNHPYSVPACSNTQYRNNIFHMRFHNYEGYFSYLKNRTDCSPVDWNYNGFPNGPDSNYNLFYMKPYNSGYVRISMFENTSEQLSYNMNQFETMCSYTGLDTNSLQAYPGMTEQSVFDTADVYSSDVENYDPLSTMNYTDIIAGGGYAKLFQTAFDKLYSKFRIDETSLAKNRGTAIPAGWPDCVTVKDGKTDLGAFENSNMLAADWSFDSDGSDSAGNNNGSFQGGASVTSSAMVGSGALSLNGSTGYVSVPDSPELRLGSNDFTISAWINHSSTTVYRGIYTKGSYLTNGGFEFYIAPNGRLRVACWKSGGTYATIDGNTCVADNTWHHVTVKREENAIKLYRDGVEDGVNNNFFTSADNFNASTTATIGCRAGNYFFSGIIDDLRVYKSALSADNITTLAKRTRINLEAHWKFDEQYGSKAFDCSGNKHDGSIYGASTVTGEYGNALSFNGSSNYVSVPDSPGLRFGSNDFTISAWIKHGSAGSTHRGIYSKGSGYNSDGIEFYIASDTGKLRVLNNNTSRNSTAIVSDNNWHHVAAVREGTSLKIYVDGVAESFSGFFSGDLSSNSNAAIGCRNGYYFFSGIIDDLRVYKRALSSDELSAAKNGK